MKQSIAQTLSQLRVERRRKWDDTKAFLDSCRTSSGTVSAENVEKYEKMEAEILDYTKQIECYERQLEIEDSINTPCSN